MQGHCGHTPILCFAPEHLGTQETVPAGVLGILADIKPNLAHTCIFIPAELYLDGELRQTFRPDFVQIFRSLEIRRSRMPTSVMLSHRPRASLRAFLTPSGVHFLALLFQHDPLATYFFYSFLCLQEFLDLCGTCSIGGTCQYCVVMVFHDIVFQ